MPVSERNPFAVLNISLDEARHLANLNIGQRRESLSLIRRYHASIYHPDRTRNPDDDATLAKINGALSALEDDGYFSRALSEYSQPTRSQRITASQRAQQQQIEYLQNQADEKIKEAELVVKRAEAEILVKDALIESFQKRLNELRNTVWELKENERLLRRTRVKSELLREKREQLSEYGENMVARIKYLNSILLSDVTIDVPEDLIGLNQVGGKRYITGSTRKIKRILRINHDLTAVEEGATLKYRSLNNTLLLGGLIESDMFDRVSPVSRRYGPVLFNLQPYLGIGMYPVVGMKDAKDVPMPLYVYGKIIDIIPIES